MANCILCGAELVEGKCPNAESHFKKMCLNCIFFDQGVCTNEETMKAVRAKIMDGIKMPGGYEIEEFKIKPVTLKDPTKKCSFWGINDQIVIEHIKNLANA